MSKLHKDITDWYFLLYDLHDSKPSIYFDNIYEFFKFNFMDYDYLRRFRYRFKKSDEDYILVQVARDNNNVYKLYAFED